jgi:hypothetical protein
MESCKAELHKSEAEKVHQLTEIDSFHHGSQWISVALRCNGAIPDSKATPKREPDNERMIDV